MSSHKSSSAGTTTVYTQVAFRKSWKRFYSTHNGARTKLLTLSTKSSECYGLSPLSVTVRVAALKTLAVHTFILVLVSVVFVVAIICIFVLIVLLRADGLSLLT